MTAPTLQAGHLFAGKYQIRALMGHGGATATYHAQLQGRDVALKVYSPQLGGRGDVLEALRIAAATTNSLPADVTAHILESGFDTQTGAPYSATDLLVVEQPLSQLVEPRRLSLPEMNLVLRGMAQVLDPAHRLRLAHLGLKPRNVLVGPAPRYAVRVVDFGVSASRVGLPTREGMLGSYPWAAPEQIAQGSTPGPAADVFAAALIAFFAMTGKSYWRACQGMTPDLSALQWEIQQARAPVSFRAQEMGAQLPAIVDSVFARALATQPEDRYATVGEFADAIATTLAGPAVAAAAQPRMNLGMTLPLSAQMVAPMPPRPTAPSSPGRNVPQAAGTPAPPVAQAPNKYAQQTVAIAQAPAPPWAQAAAPAAPAPQGGLRMDPETGLPSFSSLDDTDASEQTMSAVMASPLEAFQAAESATMQRQVPGPAAAGAPPGFANGPPMQPMMPQAPPAFGSQPALPQQPMMPQPAPPAQAASPHVSGEATVLVPRKKGKGLVIGLAVFGLLAVGGGVTAAVLLTQGGSEGEPEAATTSGEPSKGGAPTPVTTKTEQGASTTPPPRDSTATAPSPTTTEQPVAATTEDAGTGTAPAHADAGAKEAHDAAPAAEAEPAELTITCKPTCDTIKIDDKPLQSWTDPISLTAGTHVVVASKPSYATQMRYVKLKSGQKETVNFVLVIPSVAPRPCGKFLKHCP